jgi:cobalt-zinc-cadmium efflux system membrane fusion protein
MKRMVWVCLCASLACAMATSCSKNGDSGGSQGEAQNKEVVPSAGDRRVVSLAPEAVKGSAISTGVAGAHRIAVRVEAPGEVRMNSERVVQVRPRFPGTVGELRKTLGDSVAKGEVVALVNSNESFSSYDITSPLAGLVVAREASVGQAVEHDDILYTIADLSSVWADFAIYPQYAGTIRKGQKVQVRSEVNPKDWAPGIISYVGPLLDKDTRSTYGRVVLANQDSKWPPGLFVTATITISEAEVSVAVPEESIVRMADGPAVFTAQDTSFTAQRVEIGRSDGEFTEITKGLEPGAVIVVKNAFLLKAELGKSEAGDED